MMVSRARFAGKDRTATKASPFAAPPLNWLAWIDVRGTDFSRNTFGSDLNGAQVNAISGLTHRFTSNFLVGVLVGYEHFDYSSQAFNGVLKGDGWTTGAYLGWRVAPNWRFDAGAAWSEILFNNEAGTAAGNFTGHRWLTTVGVTGTYGWQSFVLEPSARIYALGNMRTLTLTRSAPCKPRATSRQAAPVAASNCPIRLRGLLRPSSPPMSESMATITSTATAPARRSQEQSRLSSLMAGRRAPLAG